MSRKRMSRPVGILLTKARAANLRSASLRAIASGPFEGGSCRGAVQVGVLWSLGLPAPATGVDCQLVEAGSATGIIMIPAGGAGTAGVRAHGPEPGRATFNELEARDHGNARPGRQLAPGQRPRHAPFASRLGLRIGGASDKMLS
jgi:hypothetical protein